MVTAFRLWNLLFQSELRQTLGSGSGNLSLVAAGETLVSYVALASAFWPLTKTISKTISYVLEQCRAVSYSDLLMVQHCQSLSRAGCNQGA